MRFIDLFAGLGGFHLALNSLGHKCVFASEIDESLRALYTQNFGTVPSGDIRTIPLSEVPEHEILCAGFPCQPFSKAGDQQGFSCPKWGDLFEYVVRLIGEKKPLYFILENVPNIMKHDNGKTWEALLSALRGANGGYQVDFMRLSPHQFGIPQVRERVFIVGSRRGLQGFNWPVATHEVPRLAPLLDKNPPEARKLSERFIACLNVWQEFLSRFPEHEELPSFPIWSMEFGATYPYADTTPRSMSLAELRDYRGVFGQPLSLYNDEQILSALPSHALRAGS